MNAVPGWGSWSFDPVLWIVLALAGTWYVSMLRRVHRKTGKAVGPGHWLPYFSGLAVLLIALASPIDVIGDSWLLWAHMVQDRFTWTQEWQVGDLVWWDNRCAMHRRDAFDPATRRLMHRTQLKGTRPV